jgi:hypothetical protein
MKKNQNNIVAYIIKQMEKQQKELHPVFIM